MSVKRKRWSALFTLPYGVLLLCKPESSEGFRQEMTRADLASNRIGPKKRLAYETGTERRWRGQRTLGISLWPEETIIQASECIVKPGNSGFFGYW